MQSVVPCLRQTACVQVLLRCPPLLLAGFLSAPLARVFLFLSVWFVLAGMSMAGLDLMLCCCCVRAAISCQSGGSTVRWPAMQVVPRRCCMLLAASLGFGEEDAAPACICFAILMLPDWLLTCVIRVTCSCDAVQAYVCSAMQHRLHCCATHCDLSVMTRAVPGMHTSGC